MARPPRIDAWSLTQELPPDEMRQALGWLACAATIGGHDVADALWNSLAYASGAPAPHSWDLDLVAEVRARVRAGGAS